MTDHENTAKRIAFSFFANSDKTDVEIARLVGRSTSTVNWYRQEFYSSQCRPWEPRKRKPVPDKVETVRTSSGVRFGEGKRKESIWKA